MKLLSTLPLTLFVSACSTMAQEPDPQPSPPAAAAGECSNEGLSRFVGQQRSPQLADEMLRASGAKTIQWIDPDTMVTMEFRADRLRVQLDAAGKVQSARCG